MSGSPEFPPTTFFRRAFCGMALIMASDIALMFASHRGLGAHLHSGIRMAFTFGALAMQGSGVAFSYFAERRLKRGMESADWSEAALEPAQSWVDGRFPKVTFLLTVVGFIGVLWALRWDAIGFLPVLVLFPLGTYSRVRTLLQKATRRDVHLTYGRLTPLRSDFWGRGTSVGPQQVYPPS